MNLWVWGLALGLSLNPIWADESCTTESSAETCGMGRKSPDPTLSLGTAKILAHIETVRCGTGRPGLVQYVAQAKIERVLQGSVGPAGKSLEVRFYRPASSLTNRTAASIAIELLPGGRAELTLTRDPLWTIVSPSDVRQVARGKGALPLCK